MGPKTLVQSIIHQSLQNKLWNTKCAPVSSGAVLEFRFIREVSNVGQIVIILV